MPAVPNLLASPRKWKKKAILIKDEAQYGVDAAPTGALNWFEARNVTLTSFEAETADRNIEMPYMGNGGKVLVGIWSKLSFQVALAGSGTLGTAPKFGPMLLALGFAETITPATSVVYNLVSEGIGGLTAYVNIDGTLYKLIGCRGDVKATLNAKGIPVLQVDLTSFYTAPVADVMPVVDRTGWTFEQAVTGTNTGKITLGAVDLAFSAFEWGLGNQVARIDLAGPQREVAITDRKPTSTFTVLAPDLATFNPYDLAANATPLVLSNTHGTVPGQKAKVDIKGGIVGVSEDQVEGMLAYKLTFEPRPVVGNDEITLTFI